MFGLVLPGRAVMSFASTGVRSRNDGGYVGG